jgi:hypothetical protein
MNREVRVAVYWDFGDLHHAVGDTQDGGDRVATDRPVDLAMIIGHVAALGRGAISRAYANWQVLGAYQDDLHTHDIDLVQLFPTGSRGRHDAPDRLALDVVEDLYERPYVTHVVVVAGNHDYARLAQSSRKLGRIFIGIGTDGVPERYIRACDEFTSYRALELGVLAAVVRRREEILRQLRKQSIRIPEHRAAFWLAPSLVVALAARFRGDDVRGLAQLTAGLLAALRDRLPEATMADVNKLRGLYLRAGVIDLFNADVIATAPRLDAESLQHVVLAHLVSSIRDLEPSDTVPFLAILCDKDPPNAQRIAVEQAVAQAITSAVSGR